MYETRMSHHVDAPPGAVYRALLDADAVAVWRVPDGMRGQVHVFEAREGGRFRVSLTYETPTGTGKTAARTDTYGGSFVRLVPDEQVVEELAFETDDPALRTTMRITTTLRAADGGTDVLLVHEGVPDAVPATDNETGTRMALTHLAHYVEDRARRA
ncbi:SRPBCC domain-containing protein [Streptomyces sp. NPDC102406]|uniref:SRPBCC domain-containing protein n=1 Tax=Streptomyces sp. NPDC102406 TaxID=3366171 RepID=UPI0038264F04